MESFCNLLACLLAVVATRGTHWAVPAALTTANLLSLVKAVCHTPAPQCLSICAFRLLQFEALLIQLFPERIQSRIEEVAALPTHGDCGPLTVAPVAAGSAAKARPAPFNLVLVRRGPVLVVSHSTSARQPLSGGGASRGVPASMLLTSIAALHLFVTQGQISGRNLDGGIGGGGAGQQICVKAGSSLAAGTSGSLGGNRLQIWVRANSRSHLVLAICWRAACVEWTTGNSRLLCLQGTVRDLLQRQPKQWTMAQMPPAVSGNWPPCTVHLVASGLPLGSCCTYCSAVQLLPDPIWLILLLGHHVQAAVWSKQGHMSGCSSCWGSMAGCAAAWTSGSCCPPAAAPISRPLVVDILLPCLTPEAGMQPMQ